MNSPTSWKERYTSQRGLQIGIAELGHKGRDMSHSPLACQTGDAPDPDAAARRRVATWATGWTFTVNDNGPRSCVSSWRWS